MTDSAKATTLHFIRHADAVPDPDAEIEAAGGYDLLGLSAKGAGQAEALARRLAATTKLAAIYSSPTRRARETAEAVARASGLDVTSDARLREVYLGDPSVEDVPTAERARAVRDRLASLSALALTRGSWSTLPDVEPGNEVRARMRSAVDAIVAAHPGRHVALVSHAGSINAYFAALLGLESEFFFPIGNTSLCSVRVERERTLLLRLNDMAHLER